MLTFTLWTTTGCNLKCTYCYEGKKPCCDMLSVETADKALEFIYRYARKNTREKSIKIMFHGGEPTLNFDVVEHVLKEVRTTYTDYSVISGLTTNGINLDERKLDFLLENITILTLSIDGDRESHDRNRKRADGSGSFDEVIQRLEYCLSKRPLLRIRMTVTANNVESFYDNVKFLAEKGCMDLVPGVDYGDKDWTKEKLEILYDQMRRIKSEIVEPAVAQGKPFSVSLVDSDNIECQNVCVGGTKSMHIHPDGKIYPCAYTVNKENFVCGNINDGIDTAKVREFMKINTCGNKVCSGCTYEKFCPATQCKFVNEALTGDYFTPSPVQCYTERLKCRLYLEEKEKEKAGA